MFLRTRGNFRSSSGVGVLGGWRRLRSGSDNYSSEARSQARFRPLGPGESRAGSCPVPRQHASPTGDGHTETVCGGDHSFWDEPAGGDYVAREGQVRGRRRDPSRRVRAGGSAQEPRGGLLFPVPHRDRVSDHAVVGRDHLCRLAVQGDRQERLPEHERADGLLRAVQLLGRPGLPGTPASADLTVPAPLRPRAGPSARAAGVVQRRDRCSGPRHPRGGHPAEGIRSGAALFDRQVFGRAALPPGPREDQASGESSIDTVIWRFGTVWPV